MHVKKPLISDKLQDNIDEISLNILKNFAGISKIEEIKPLVDAAYYLNFCEFKDALLATIACEFYVGASDADLEKFKAKHGIKEFTDEE